MINDLIFPKLSVLKLEVLIDIWFVFNYSLGLASVGFMFPASMALISKLKNSFS